MGARVKPDKNSAIIPMKELPFGKIAEVNEGKDRGTLIMKQNSGSFIVLGCAITTAEGRIINNGWGEECPLLVRILQPGELIEVV